MINVQNLSKYYSSKRALGPVSFEIEQGETVGFLGLNGAGKTTALRILACDLRPSSGDVHVGGLDALSNPHDVRKMIGYLPETTPLYTDMTVTDYLWFAGRLRGMSANQLRTRMPKVLDLTHTSEVRNEPIRNLSHGFRQRVGVAQAVVHEPKLLILDEPTRGLDPVQIVEMRNMIHDLKEAHTVLISSHILTEISQTCDRLLVLGSGEIIASGSEQALSAGLIETKRIEVMLRAKDDTDLATIKQALEQLDGVTSIASEDTVGQTHLLEIHATSEVRPEVCRLLVEAGHDVIKIDQAQSKLESVFLNLVQGGDRARN